MSRYSGLAVPVLLAGGLIATEFASGNAGSFATLARPMAIAMIGAGAIEATVFLIVRRTAIAVAVSTLFVLS